MLNHLAVDPGASLEFQVDDLDGADALEVLTAPLERAKVAAARIGRAHGVLRPQSAAAGFSLQEPHARPSRFLQPARRSPVNPLIVRHNWALPNCSSLLEGLSAAGAAAANHDHPYRIIADFALHCRLSLRQSALILRQRGVLVSALSSAELKFIERAQEFFRAFRDGRLALNAGLLTDEINNAAPHWGLFDDRQLRRLLPGIRVPHALRREQYLGNLVAEEEGTGCLDLYAFPSGKPLFRHPFGW